MSSFYNDPAIRLSKEEMKKAVGKPLLLEHDPNQVIGMVTKVTESNGIIHVEYELK